MSFVIRGRCRRCGHLRVSAVQSRRRRHIERLFATIRDYYCPGGHYELERSFLEAYEWDFGRIEALNGRVPSMAGLVSTTSEAARV